MFTLIRKLYHTRLLTVAGLWYLLHAILTTGINLMVLLRIAAKLYPDRIAVTDDQERSSYIRLWEQAETLAVALHVDYGVHGQQKVAIVCRNHAAAIKTIFAVSRLGAHLFLLNPEMSADQLLALADRLQLDFVVYDEQIAHVFKNSVLRNKSLPAYHPIDDSIDRLSSSSSHKNVHLEKMGTGNIVVMTGGTTGQPKSVSRKPSVLNYLPPFFALLTQAHLDKYQSVYITTPICHGYGLSFLFIASILGTEMYFSARFDAARACSLVAAHKIQVIIVVPLILERMLKLGPDSLSSLQCIITGSALLNPALAQETLEQLGAKLFNLYGSSEAGFCIMATPDVLGQKPESIGKPVQGVRVKIIQDSDQVGTGMIGHLCIRSTWTSNRSGWIDTGDLAYRDIEGDIFLCGRIDDMIISGGENVYPIELENILTQHPDIDSVAVFGIPDQEFGQRLKALVVKKQDTALNQSILRDWLKSRVARYQMPAIIEFRDELAHTCLGKLDKKSLQG